MKITPLSWCIVISAAANVGTAAMLAWFLFSRPFVHVSGVVNVLGRVEVEGQVSLKPDKNAIQRVEICEETFELPQSPIGADRALARRSMHGTLRHRSGA